MLGPVAAALGQDELEVVVPAGAGVDADPVGRPARGAVDPRDPDAVRRDLAGLEIPGPAGEPDRIAKEGGQAENGRHPAGLGRRYRVVADGTGRTVAGARTAAAARGRSAEAADHAVDLALGDPRELGVGSVEDPARKLGPDRAEIGRLPDGQVGQETEDALELPPSELVGRPGERLPVGPEADPERVEAAAAEAGRDDLVDAFPVEEGESRADEVRRALAVVDVRVEEKQGPVGPAAEPLPGVAGQRPQPGPDEVLRPQRRFVEDPFDLRQRLGRRRLGGEEELREQGVEAGQARRRRAWAARRSPRPRRSGPGAGGATPGRWPARAAGPSLL